MFKLCCCIDRNWGDGRMIAIIFAALSGVTIVLSRSINGLLSKKLGPYPSTFFNYFTGFITSFILMVCVGFPYLQNISNLNIYNPIMYIGGIIGVFNILILNSIVHKVSPIQLTLITFISQLITGLLLDYCFYQMFSLNKFWGCILVIAGMCIYQIADKKDSNTVLENIHIEKDGV